jgi:hypothetical protein
MQIIRVSMSTPTRDMPIYHCEDNMTYHGMNGSNGTSTRNSARAKKKPAAMTIMTTRAIRKRLERASEAHV